ncbi:MAG: electron-transfer flavoprotein:ubiquinone oxidoreductase [Rubrivivax sp.]|nr:electron-transfer flavoprotein:ubiquinone oxidoreductase [Rubrivivax sp.]
MSSIDFLIVGAGPAGLAAALRLKRKLKEMGRNDSVVVVEKAPTLGYHTLSGAVFEPACLDELVPGWRESDDAFVKSLVKVERDELYYLSGRRAFKIPPVFIPRDLCHLNDYTVSLGRMVEWLGKLAEKEGVEICTGFSVGALLHENGKVLGVKLVDQGLDTHATPKSNFLPGEELRASVTLLADGARGVASRQLIEIIGKGKNPQVYSLGVKQLIKLPPNNTFGNNRTIHTIGYPNRSDVFGGGFLYSMGNDVVAVGLILGLDWKYQDLNPQQELEAFKSQPFIHELLKDGQVLISGVKTIPEGGYYSLPGLCTDGAMVLGDAAGFVNMQKIKGIHYAIFSGICAADALMDALPSGDYSRAGLAHYKTKLKERGIFRDLFRARNFRQVFKFGLFPGALISRFQQLLPSRVSIERDNLAIEKGARLEREVQPGMDRAQFVSLSGAAHREDEPSHIKIIDSKLCIECTRLYGAPCTFFCPGEVYRVKGDEIILSPSNCMHDCSCQVKCPHENILWTPPEGGEGPRFKQM